jgi:methyl-accepting chemotaxis protein
LVFAIAIIAVSALFLWLSIYDLRMLSQTANKSIQSVEAQLEKSAAKMRDEMNTAFATVLKDTENVITGLSNDHLNNLAVEVAGRMQSVIENAMDTARTLAMAVEGYKSETPDAELDRNVVVKLFHGVQKNSPEFVGIWIGFEPNAFDGKDDEFKGREDIGCDNDGRFIPAWGYSEKGRTAIELLEDIDISEYYTVAKETKQEFVTDPFEYNNILLFSVAVPIVIDGKVIGVAGVDLDVSLFDTILADFKPHGTGYAYLIHSNGLYLWHPNKRLVENKTNLIGRPGRERFGEALQAGRSLTEIVVQTAAANVQGVQANTELFQALTTFKIGRNPKPWGLIISAEKENVLKELISIETMLRNLNENSRQSVADMITTVKGADEKAQQELAKDSAWAVKLMISFAIVVPVVVLPFVFFFGRSFARPILQGVDVLHSMATEGDLSKKVPSCLLKRADELGALGRSIQEIQQSESKSAEIASSLADRDWSHTVTARSEHDVLCISIGKMITQINEALHEISANVMQVATSSGEVLSSAQSLAGGTQEAAASLEEITASMQEISSQTKTNAESAGQARVLAQNTNQVASEGQSAMQEMTSAMGRITQNSNEIQRVIKVIDDIAFQTNLLALNAAVEAARAGQHGKGFAVVAEEVRNLASRSAKAAQETSELISKSGQEIERGGAVASRTADTLNTIVEQIKLTTDIVSGIAVASNEQAQGVNQITIGLQQIDTVTQQNTAAAEQSASAANEMSGMATTLQKLVAQFKLRN